MYIYNNTGIISQQPKPPGGAVRRLPISLMLAVPCSIATVAFSGTTAPMVMLVSTSPLAQPLFAVQDSCTKK